MPIRKLHVVVIMHQLLVHIEQSSVLIVHKVTKHNISSQGSAVQFKQYILNLFDKFDILVYSNLTCNRYLL